MFKKDSYHSIKDTRKLLDIYTFVDFAIFHKTILHEDEIDCLYSLIKTINIRDSNIKKCVEIIQNLLYLLRSK